VLRGSGPRPPVRGGRAAQRPRHFEPAALFGGLPGRAHAGHGRGRAALQPLALVLLAPLPGGWTRPARARTARAGMAMGRLAGALLLLPGCGAPTIRTAARRAAIPLHAHASDEHRFSRAAARFINANGISRADPAGPARARGVGVGGYARLLPSAQGDDGRARAADLHARGPERWQRLLADNTAARARAQDAAWRCHEGLDAYGAQVSALLVGWVVLFADAPVMLSSGPRIRPWRRCRAEAAN
jgi:hypothetical protein